MATASAIEPESLWELGERLGYAVRVTWSREQGVDCVDVLFERPGDDAQRRSWVPGRRPVTRTSSAQANNPLQTRQSQQLAPALRSYLQAKLPEYMIPSAFVMLERLPLTPNGKVDRRALPAPEKGRSSLRDRYVQPRTAVERQLAQIWMEVLGLAEVGIHDNFFELGGHSLLATQVVSRIRTTFTVELPLRVLFESPTVAELALRVEGVPSTELPPIVPTPRQDELPLSFAQQRLWFLDQMGMGGAYNMPLVLRLKGNLDQEALRRAFGEIVRRHEALRTTFTSRDGQPRQVIHPADRWVLPVEDLSQLAASEREDEAQRRSLQEGQRPFDLSRQLPLRTMLLRLDEQDHVLLIMLHHIVSDGWSLGVLVRELTSLYTAFTEGRPSPLAELPVQYADFARWQRNWLQGDLLEQELSYWRQQLGGCSVLALPTDRPRPAVQTYAGAMQVHTLPADLHQALERLNQSSGVTLYMTMLAAFQVLLSRYTGQDDIVVGSPIANRNRQEIEGLIGFFVNSLAMRTELSDNPTFKELLDRVRKTTLEAYAHQDLPFEKLVEELQPERDLSQNPLFQIMFAVQNAPMEDLLLPGLTLSHGVADITTTRFDMEWHLWEDADKVQVVALYNTDLFDATTIERMLGHYRQLLQGIVADPMQRVSQLPLLHADERRQLLADWNDTQATYPSDQTIPELFEAQVARTPNAVAVVFGQQQLDYAQLNARANQLAHHLRSLGVGPESRVGVCLERSPEMVVALLGTLKAGGAYVPLDPSYPRVRLAYGPTPAPHRGTQQQRAGLPEAITVILLDAQGVLDRAHTCDPTDADRVCACCRSTPPT